MIFKRLFITIWSFLFIQISLVHSQELIGTSNSGGDSDYGVLFSYNLSTDTFTKLFDFKGGSTEGRYPSGSIIQASDGKIYGMTAFGGIFDDGSLFEYNISTGTYSHYDLFHIDGEYPSLNGLVEASNGKLYGLTQKGSIDSFGILFEFDLTTKILTRKISLGGIPGISGLAEGSLIEASNGKLYGMSRSGGENGDGAIYEYDIDTNTITVVHSLNEPDGRGPRGSLMQASNGKLYGMTTIGGSNSLGVLFEYDLVTSTYTKKFDFNTNSGTGPWKNLMEASNGKLYGMTLEGGSNGKGVIFEFDIVTDTFTKKVDFTGANGSSPLGSIIEGTNGKLYGKTQTGGDNDFGVVFEFNPLDDTYLILKSFNGTSEGKYLRGNLIEVDESVLSINNFGGNEIFKFYPNPVKEYLSIKGELSSIESIDIYSINGQFIMKIHENFDNIDLGFLNPSVYFAKFNTLNSSEIIKIIKQ